MPFPITHLALTVLTFDLLRDITKGVRIRNRYLALLAVCGIVPDIDIFLVPFFGWDIHKLWTHNLLALAVFALIMVVLAVFVGRIREGYILFGLGIFAYGLHILTDFVMRTVPLFHPFDSTYYGFALLGSSKDYLQFSTFDTTVIGLFFLYYLITGFTTFRYAYNFAPARFWYRSDFEDGVFAPVRGHYGFLRKTKVAWRLKVRVIPPAESGPRAGIERAMVELWSIEDPNELLYSSTFYVGIGELAHDAELFIRLVKIMPETKSKKILITLEILPAKFTGLMEITQRLTGRHYFKLYAG